MVAVHPLRPVQAPDTQQGEGGGRCGVRAAEGMRTQALNLGQPGITEGFLKGERKLVLPFLSPVPLGCVLLGFLSREIRQILLSPQSCLRVYCVQQHLVLLPQPLFVL